MLYNEVKLEKLTYFTMQKPYILIVEDEEAISMLIEYNLNNNGFETQQAFTGKEAIEQIDSRTPDLIILDWMLPEMSGIEVLEDIRQYESTKNIPVIMVTARSEETDKLTGFNSGTDDYMVKPFSPQELIARIKSVLKRSKPELIEKTITYGDLEIDNKKMTISYQGTALKLAPTEYDLLTYLITKAEKCCSREAIIRNVWPDNEEIDGRAVDVTIRRIRKSLSDISAGSENIIKTIRGSGYILEED